MSRSFRVVAVASWALLLVAIDGFVLSPTTMPSGCQRPAISRSVDVIAFGGSRSSAPKQAKQAKQAKQVKKAVKKVAKSTRDKAPLPSFGGFSLPSPPKEVEEELPPPPVIDFDDDDDDDFGDFNSGAPPLATAPVTIGAGVTGAVAGGVLADAALSAAGVGLTGELLTDTAMVGAVLLGGGAVYAAGRPDEAGEAVRFVGGSVANVTEAYAELAAVNAELAILEQQQKAQAAVDAKVAEIQALPGQLQQKAADAATDALDAAKAAPKKALDSVSESIKASLDGAQDQAKQELEEAKRRARGDF